MDDLELHEEYLNMEFTEDDEYILRWRENRSEWEEAGVGLSATVYRLPKRMVDVLKLIKKDHLMETVETEVKASILLQQRKVPGVGAVMGYMMNFDAGHHAIFMQDGGSPGCKDNIVKFLLSFTERVRVYPPLNSEVNHGDVGAHNVVYNVEEKDGSEIYHAKLIDFGCATFKDASGLSPLPTHNCASHVDPIVTMLTAAAKSGTSPWQDGDCRHDGWLTDTYAWAKMVTQRMDWTVHPLRGLMVKEDRIEEDRRDLYELVSHLLAQRWDQRWTVEEVADCNFYKKWCQTTHVKGTKFVPPPTDGSVTVIYAASSAQMAIDNILGGLTAGGDVGQQAAASGDGPESEEGMAVEASSGAVDEGVVAGGFPEEEEMEDAGMGGGSKHNGANGGHNGPFIVAQGGGAAGNWPTDLQAFGMPSQAVGGEHQETEPTAPRGREYGSSDDAGAPSLSSGGATETKESLAEPAVQYPQLVVGSAVTNGELRGEGQSVEGNANSPEEGGAAAAGGGSKKRRLEAEPWSREGSGCRLRKSKPCPASNTGAVVRKSRRTVAGSKNRKRIAGRKTAAAETAAREALAAAVSGVAAAAMTGNAQKDGNDEVPVSCRTRSSNKRSRKDDVVDGENKDGGGGGSAGGDVGGVRKFRRFGLRPHRHAAASNSS